MRIHVVLLVLTFSGPCSLLEKNEDHGLTHHLQKRQAADSLGAHGGSNPGSQSLINGQIPSQSSSSPSSDPSPSPSPRPGRGRPYYQYQPPSSSGSRASGSQVQFQLSGRSRSQQPGQSHVAGVTRYTFTQPRRHGGAGLGQGVGGVVGDRSGGGGGGGGAEAGESRGEGSQHQSSVSGDEEPVVEVFPSEHPVLNPQASHLQQLRQREAARQRHLEQLRRQQQAAGGAAQRHRASPGFQQRVFTGAQSQGGGQGRPTQYGGQRPFPRQVFTGPQFQGGVQGRPTQYGGQRPLPRQVYGGLQPVHGSSQGQQVFASGGRWQRPYGYGNYGYPQGGSYGYPQGGFVQGGYDSECPNTGIRIQINGIPCEQAVDVYGSYLCYRHEYTSRECCLKCRTLKDPSRVGCEYGDHSGRCQQLQPYDCYDLRNRQGCCDSCQRMRIAGARSGCEYGDMTPNCEQVRQNPGLCYIPENRYLCCQTCSTIRVTEDPECPWGDQNADLCQPFDRSGNIRINCYAAPIKRICCQACQRLEDWIPINQPGCEYGDRPVTFNTGSHRNLNCTSFMRHYGYEQCSLNQAVATNCCYTCHRFTQG
ncbi:uncharacterized protein LOC143287022 [Babylonia areolata]|uniref:uncharacterized protein LOC143287022 n=1 Tax=Babylonia areolata TaxID=304850 RepID=UPI003FD6A81E